jgi:ribosomal protein S27E
MSEFVGLVRCPECGCLGFEVRNYATYMSVVCYDCGHKIGEIPVK